MIDEMDVNNTIKVFDEKQVRSAWDAEQEKWFFSIIDVIAALTGSPRPRKYWNALKTKLKDEGSELSHKMGQLKMPAEDGKMRKTDVADTEQLFRLIQSIPSPLRASRSAGRKSLHRADINARRLFSPTASPWWQVAEIQLVLI